jgi:hypothetical protein
LSEAVFIERLFGSFFLCRFFVFSLLSAFEKGPVLISGRHFYGIVLRNETSWSAVRFQPSAGLRNLVFFYRSQVRLADLSGLFYGFSGRFAFLQPSGS